MFLVRDENFRTFRQGHATGNDRQRLGRIVGDRQFVFAAADEIGEP